MNIISARRYEVTAADFPIRVEVTAVDLDDNLAVVGSVREVVGGLLVRRRSPKVADAGLIKRYSIDKPSVIPCELTHHIDGWFPDNALASARYTVDITSHTGATARATLRVPSINPNFASFTFRVL